MRMRRGVIPMNESMESEDRSHKDTEVLQQVAAEAEHDRAVHGRSKFDAPDLPDEQLMSDAAAHSEDSPDIDADTREDHFPGGRPVTVVSENGGGSILREGPGEPRR